MNHLIACSMCSAPFRPLPGGHRGFCLNCVGKIKADAFVAENHIKRINAGDMKTVPDNESQKQTRDEERRRQLRGMT